MLRKLVMSSAVLSVIAAISGCVAVSSKGNIHTRGDYEAVATNDGIYLVDTNRHVATKVRVVSDEEFRSKRDQAK